MNLPKYLRLIGCLILPAVFTVVCMAFMFETGALVGVFGSIVAGIFSGRIVMEDVGISGAKRSLLQFVVAMLCCLASLSLSFMGCSFLTPSGRPHSQ